MQCEMCGAKVESLQKYNIEGVELNVCTKCSLLGSKIEKKRERKNFDEKQHESFIINDAGKKIKEEREKRGMRQKDLAKMLMIKDSYLHHIENNDLSLTIHIAKKVENLLGIKIIKRLKHSQEEKIEKSSESLTIGNLFKNNRKLFK